MTTIAKTVAVNCADSRLANAACRFNLLDRGEEDSALSMLASRLTQEMRHLAQAEDDMDLFLAPGECMHIIASAAAHRVSDTVHAFGYPTLSAAVDAIERRTSAKFVYAFGFGALEEVL